MTAYPAFIYPDPVFYEQPVTESLTDGLDRPGLPALLSPEEVATLAGFEGVRRSTPRQSHSATAFLFPTWADHLFGHILIIPPRLDLGNILSSQTRTIEIANLYLEDREWSDADTDVVGLTFANLPAFGSPATPYLLPSFGSYLLQIGISADGPASIDGDITFTFDVGQQTVPVTGQRVVLWAFQPQPGIVERLEWKTNVLESYDGTEQRITIRSTPRQIMQMQFIKFDAVERRAKALLFDWLPRVFAVPIWFEARRLTAPAAVGSTTLVVDTANADFREGSLLFIYSNDTAYEAVQIETITVGSMTLASELTRDYQVGALVMPARTAFAKTVPQAPRLPAGGSVFSMEFVVIDNTDLSDTTGSSEYDDKVLLDDCNLVSSGESDAWDRPVIVLDNDSGRVFQSSRTDRSRFRTSKQWDAPTLDEVWRIRTLLHAFAGNRVSFWLPSFRADLVMTDTIAPGGLTFRVEECGYTALIQSRRPMADVRMVFTSGDAVVRRVTDSEVDGTEEVLTIDAAFDPINPIDPEDVLRIELVNLVRIADDVATFEHRRLGDAMVSINVVSVKE